MHAHAPINNVHNRQQPTYTEPISMNIGFFDKLTVMQSCSFILVRNMQDADIGELGSYYNILLKQCLGFKTQQNAIRQLQFTAICLTQVFLYKFYL